MHPMALIEGHTLSAACPICWHNPKLVCVLRSTLLNHSAPQFHHTQPFQFPPTAHKSLLMLVLPETSRYLVTLSSYMSSGFIDVPPLCF